MAYKSRNGRRPMEYASRSAHGHIIKDDVIQAFLAQCELPKNAENVDLSETATLQIEPASDNPIKHIIAVDGGYQAIQVRAEFPSAEICFFQFGALIFSVEDLKQIDEQPFIEPSDMAKLNQIQRFKLTLPIKNVALKGKSTLTHSVRQAVYNFFAQASEPGSLRLIDTLAWFVFQTYATPLAHWVLATCPECGDANIPLDRLSMTKQYTFRCAHCGGEILLTDVFRLHEAIDDELGAGGILGYVTTTIEQILLVHLIRIVLQAKPSLLDQILFIKDGPLAFFGQTANMHKPMRALVNFLFDEHNLFLAGLEKSGAFVDHADEIRDLLLPGQVLILNNQHIYKYVIPGQADPSNPYGRTTYYGNKLIFKTNQSGMYVASLPTREVLSDPKVEHFKNLQVILSNIEMLRCDMYDNALIPVALANKLVSLSNHPSSKILQRFAVGAMRV